MKSNRIIPAVVIGVVSFAISVLAVLGGRAISAQDTSAKYTVQVPGGLAFSEFRGYEGWQVVSISQSEQVMAVILGESRDDRGLPGRHSRQRQAFPRRRQDGEDPLDSEEDGDVPRRRRCRARCTTSTSW